MSRRVSLPAADELFRSTRHTREMRDRGTAAREMASVPGRVESVDPASYDRQPVSHQTPEPAEVPVAETAAEKAARKSSGRVRHDEKMTVYVTADELLDIEHARLSLRRDQGLAVDRGRLVREAIAIVLADLEANGDDSVLVQRLIGR
ncbi:MAG: hypothetical protein JWR85_776 [Marmoricola sp.]|nr:hypothetical protein [Marmoricola sp.]